MAILIKLGQESEVYIAHQLMQEAFAEIQHSRCAIKCDD